MNLDISINSTRTVAAEGRQPNSLYCCWQYIFRYGHYDGCAMRFSGEYEVFLGKSSGNVYLYNPYVIRGHFTSQRAVVFCDRP